jgi:hypothetical protein
MKIRNSLVGALAISGAVFGAVYGAAATFPLDGGAAQQATDSTLECQTGEVSVSSWGVNPTNDDGTGGKVTFVQLEGIDASCVGNRLMGQLQGEGGESDIVGYLTTLDNGPGGTGGAKTFADAATITAPGSLKLQLIETDGSHGVDASEIEGLVLWIEGGSAVTLVS